MQPVVTPAELAAVDEEAPEPIDELIARAAWAVAVQAIEMLDFAPYGKRVAILAGPGKNGQDGRLAVPQLHRRGAKCTIFDIGNESTQMDQADRALADHDAFDLVIDACFGTGLRRDFDAASLPIHFGSTPVLAVDIPSGVDGLTGELRGEPISADRTVTFAAPKPGLLLPPGRQFVGDLVVADIGLDCSRATIAAVLPSDVFDRWPRRSAAAHKWQRAVLVIGGSQGMAGAVALASEAALRSGAGYVTQVIPPTSDAAVTATSMTTGTAVTTTMTTTTGRPIEAVQRQVSAHWAADLLGPLDTAGSTDSATSADTASAGVAASATDRHGAAVIGPGLPTARIEQVREVESFLESATARLPIPIVVDAGALGAVATLADRGWQAESPLVITPHDGEFARLTGKAPGRDRVAAARELAIRLNAVVLLKGQTTVIAEPGGRVLLSTAGDQRLATAGTGDVLSGVIASGMAGGLDPFTAAGLGAELHGLAAARCFRVGMTAGDLPRALAELLSEIA